MKVWINWIKSRHPELSPDEFRFYVSERIGYISIVLNSILGLIKLVSGFLVHSVSVRADGFNNLSDALGNIGIIFFTKKSQKRPDRKHPYGYERWDPISTLILAMIIGFFGYQVLMESFQSFSAGSVPETYSLAVIGLLVFSIAVKGLMSVGYYQASKILDSPILKAYGVDARNDVISTLFVLASTLCTHFLHIEIDGFTGIILAAIIFYSAYDLIHSVVSTLLGEAADPTLVSRLKNMLVSDESIVDAHDIKIHEYGPNQIYASAHVEMLDVHQSLMEAHNVIDLIERRVNRELKIDLVIHIDPIAVPDEETANLRIRIGSILHRVDERWIMHDFRREQQPEGQTIYFDLEIPFGQDYTASQIVEMIQEHLKPEEKYTIVTKIDHF